MPQNMAIDPTRPRYSVDFNALQTHLSEFQLFLVGHLDKTLELKERSLSAGPADRLSNSYSLRSADLQVQAVQGFLDTHILALQDLQLALSHPPQTATTSELILGETEKPIARDAGRSAENVNDENDITMIEAEKYSLLSRQFSTLVVISTFTASVVVAFLALMHDIHTDEDSAESTIFGRVGTYQVGVILGFLSFSANLGVAVLAGANAVVSSYAAASPSGRRQLVRSRAHRLMFCGYVQLLSALSFGVSIFLLLNLVLGRVIASLSFVIYVLAIFIACWDLAFQRPPSPRLIYETLFPQAS